MKIKNYSENNRLIKLKSKIIYNSFAQHLKAILHISLMSKKKTLYKAFYKYRNTALTKPKLIRMKNEIDQNFEKKKEKESISFDNRLKEKEKELIENKKQIESNNEQSNDLSKKIKQNEDNLNNFNQTLKKLEVNLILKVEREEVPRRGAETSRKKEKRKR